MESKNISRQVNALTLNSSLIKNMKWRRQKGVQFRDFLIPEKFGIVVISGYALFLYFGASAW